MTTQISAAGGASQLTALAKLLHKQSTQQSAAAGSLASLLGNNDAAAPTSSDDLLSGLGAPSPVATPTLSALLQDAEGQQKPSSDGLADLGQNLGSLAKMVGSYALAGSTGGASLLL